MGVHKKFGNPGEKYGRLTIIGEAEPHICPNGDKKRQVICNCDCGNKNIIVRLHHLISGNTKSCGCYKREQIKEIGKNSNKSSKSSKRLNVYEFDYETNIATGYTSKGQPFYFDIEDYDKIKEYKWHISLDGYVVSAATKTQKEIRMHRLIMDCPKGKVVDHINHCKNNNCKNNLRICTHSENMKNKKKSKNNTSGVTGVSWDKEKKRWRVQIVVNGKNIRCGRYKTIDEAIKARKEAEIKYFGVFAYTES